LSAPSSPPPVPAIVRRFAAGRPVRAVWVNELGGVTFRVGKPGIVAEVEFIKVVSANRKVVSANRADLAGEAQRLRWAGRYLKVPEVLGQGVDGDRSWLRTRGLAGLSAVHPLWLAAPDVAVRAIGAGLRTLHDRFPVPSCPFDWSVTARLATLPTAERSRLGEPPPVDQLVVCHGDPCSPNTLIDDEGRCCGHVDLGDLGVAIDGPTSPSRRSRWAGTIPGRDGMRTSSPPTASSRTRYASTTTGGCGKPRMSRRAKLGG
jgi:kanamycin kinase